MKIALTFGHNHKKDDKGNLGEMRLRGFTSYQVGVHAVTALNDEELVGEVDLGPR